MRRNHHLKKIKLRTFLLIHNIKFLTIHFYYRNSRWSQNNNRKQSKNNKVATLRKEVINKFKSSSQRTSSSGSSQKLKDILMKAEFKKFKHLLSSDESDKVPEFDCSGGLQLSDSSDSDEEQQPRSSKPVLQMKKTSSQDTNESEDFEKNMQKMQEIASKLAGPSHTQGSYKSSQKENVNVADLLAMGENEGDGSSKTKHSKKRAKASQQAEESDSDNWEDVEGKKLKLKAPLYVSLLKKYEYNDE